MDQDKMAELNSTTNLLKSDAQNLKSAMEVSLLRNKKCMSIKPESAYKAFII